MIAMSKPIRHVVFTPSGAGTLRQALKAAGRNDDVVSLFDDLSFGPIGTLDPFERARWVAEELGWDDWEEVSARAAFWNEALSADHRKIVWMSRRSAMEFAGFLAWLWRLQDASCDIVDLTEQKINRPAEHRPPLPPRLVVSTGLLSPAEITGDRLFDQSRPLAPAERESYRSLWTTLRSENAPLRVIANGALVSAPISFFDNQLMSLVKRDWQKVAIVVGNALVAQMDDHIFQAGDLFLAARVNDLVEKGRLECRGEPPLDVQRSEIRLPQRACG
jgi:Protein of unknown function/Domain of unknown function (DUF1835)